MIRLKNSIENSNSRLDHAEEKINTVEDRLKEQKIELKGWKEHKEPMGQYKAHKYIDYGSSRKKREKVAKKLNTLWKNLKPCKGI